MSLFGTPETRTGRFGRWSFPLLVSAVLLMILLASPLVSSTSGATLKDTLAQKQAELNAAYAEYKDFQDKLNELAAQYNSAEVRMAQIDDAISAVEKEINLAQKDEDAAQAQLTQRVVSIYKDGLSSGSVYLEVLFASSDFTTILQRFSLLRKMADQDQRLFDQVGSYLDKNQQREATLEEKRKAQTAQMHELQTLQGEMNDKFAASSSDYKRLTSQVLKLRDEVRKAQEAAAAAAAAAALRKTNTAKSNSNGGVVQPGSFVFPVDGPHSFTDSWGAARSGGRTHKGTDILAAKGTPVVACVNGTITSVSTRDTGLGGKTVWLRGSNGTGYYYAHLDGIASGIYKGVSVGAGQVLGYVGDTGNANGCYHLHFGMYPGGGAAADPYATLRAAD
jgi:murein DD-endopeptidase MepM/ murein hydrolase activator NlpD